MAWRADILHGYLTLSFSLSTQCAGHETGGVYHDGGLRYMTTMTREWQCMIFSHHLGDQQGRLTMHTNSLVFCTPQLPQTKHSENTSRRTTEPIPIELIPTPSLLLPCGEQITSIYSLLKLIVSHHQRPSSPHCLWIERTEYPTRALPSLPLP
jgi:hypothetical protein